MDAIELDTPQPSAAILINTYHYHRSTLLQYHSEEVTMRSSFSRSNPYSGGFAPVIAMVRKTIKVRQARNGTIRISLNSLAVDHCNAAGIISHLPSPVLEALNEVLDKYEVRTFTEEECGGVIKSYDNADETLYAAQKRGAESLAVRTILRVLHGQMPVYMSLMKPAISFWEHPLHDFYYDDAETIYSTTLPFMFSATLKEFAYRAFGFYRKDLIKLLATVDGRSLTWVSWFKGGLTPDQTIRVLSHYRDTPLGPHEFPLLENALVGRIANGSPHPTTLLNLALGKHPLELEHNHILSSIWTDNAPELSVKVNGWEALYQRALKVSADRLQGFTAHVPEGFTALNGAQLGDYSVHILKTPSDYYYTGQQMGLCVGQMEYMKPAHDGEALHIRFDQGEHMFALLDIRKEEYSTTYSVREFRGPQNHHVSNETELITAVRKSIPYQLIAN